MVDWRLTREDTYGYGAGARFRLEDAAATASRGATRRSIEVERPRRIVEAGRGGKFNRIRTLGVYDARPGVGAAPRACGSRCRPSPRLRTDKLPRAFGARGWMKRKLKQVACAACASILEEDRGRGARPTLAGGSRKPATGSPFAPLGSAVAPCPARLAHARRSSPSSAPSPSAPAATRRTSPSTATTEGIYLDVGGLKYQVQISRLLNPTDREDSGYLVGLPADQQLGPDENWFAVFMRVRERRPTSPSRPTDGYSIRDTQGNIYRPIAMGAEERLRLPRGRRCSPRTILPLPDSPAGRGHDPGLAAAVQDPGRQLPEPPARAPIPPPNGTARRAPSTSTCSGPRRSTLRGARSRGRPARARARVRVPRGRFEPRLVHSTRALGRARRASPPTAPPLLVALSPASSTSRAAGAACRRRRPSDEQHADRDCGRPLPAGA